MAPIIKRSECIHYIFLLSKHVLSIYYMLGTPLHTGETAVNKNNSLAPATMKYTKNFKCYQKMIMIKC